MRREYQTDLNDDREWLRINEFFAVLYAKGGRPIQHSKKEILNAIFYILRTGCQWRYLPHDFPPWKTVYTYFRNWKQAGIFEKINYVLIKQARSKIGRNEKPSACIADSQSVKTTEKGGSRVMMEQRKLKVERGI
jgi:putative transposase